MILYSGILSVRLATVAPPAHLMVDDGYYYLGIARNLARGLGSTWDGIHPTNGYHPLWLLSLVPIYRLAPSPEIALRAVFVLQAIVAAVAAGLLYLVCRRCVDRRCADRRCADRRYATGLTAPVASCLAVLFWLGLSYRLLFSGLEYGFAVVSLLAVAFIWLRDSSLESRDGRRHLALGLALALAFLARIEGLLLAAVIVSIQGRRLIAGSLRRGAVQLLALAGPVALTATAYAIFNHRVFGHPLPISGAVKVGWSQLALGHDPLLRQGGWLVAKAAHLFWPLRQPLGAWSLALVAGTLGIALAWLARRRLRFEGLEPLAPLIAFSVLSYLGYALIYHGIWSRTAWYYALQPILAAILLAALLERWQRAGRGGGSGRRRWWVAATALIGIWLVLRTLGGMEKLRPAAGAGAGPVIAALAELPEDAVLASWNGGALGYLSGRTMVSLDGLVNSWDYLRSGRRDLCRYWRREGITHLVDAFDLTREPPFMPIFPGYPELQSDRACSDRLRLVWSDPRSAPAVRVAIFEIRHDEDPEDHRQR